jgi:exopolysaccharide biosynthesis polyprenyl glycosylphosphotransferase
MLYYNVRLVGTHLLIIDAAAFVCFVAASSWIVEPELWARLSATGPVFGGSIVVAFLAFVGVGSRLNAYHARRTEPLAKELVCVAEVSIYAAAVAILVRYFGGIAVDAAALGRVALISVACMISMRLSMRLVIRHLRRRGRDDQIWLIVGSSRRARDLIESISANKHFGIRIQEIVDLPPRSDDVSPPEDRGWLKDVRHLKDVNEIRQIIEETVIDEVVITLPVRSYYDEIQQIISMGRESGISIMLPPDAFGHPGFRSELTSAGNVPMVTHFTGPSNYVQLGMKRLIDVAGSSIGLVLLAPLFVVIAAAVKIDSAGTVFFRSPRIGLHGRKFQMVKFRSMVADAPRMRRHLSAMNETDGVAFKIKNDPRITRVGKILRAYHLDELPQLWNVLAGDMSLVGPRPLPENEAAGREWWHRRRLSMPPGMTCFWQITGDHKMPFRDWASLDLRYIDNWSVWLDLKLIFATILMVFRRPGW